MPHIFVFLVTLLVRTIRATCRSHAELVLENLALRQQVCALKQRRPRLRLDDAVRGFWVALRASWPRWTSWLVLVKPATVVAWHRHRFRRHWTRLSQRGRRPGRLFIVPTITMQVLYGLFVIEHARRRILHFNATFHPTAAWFRSPWQNGTAERWVGNCRRELLDHVVVFNARHLVRLVRRYIRYYHADRTHLGLAKDTPATRPVTPRPAPSAEVVALPRVGGLHHRYEWRDAA